MKWTIETTTMPHVIGHANNPLVIELDGSEGEARDELYRMVCHITPQDGSEAVAIGESGHVIRAWWDSGVSDVRMTLAADPTIF